MLMKINYVYIQLSRINPPKWNRYFPFVYWIQIHIILKDPESHPNYHRYLISQSIFLRSFVNINSSIYITFLYF